MGKNAEITGLVFFMTIVVFGAWVMGYIDDFMGAILAALFLAALAPILHYAGEGLSKVKTSRAYITSQASDGTWVVERVTRINRQAVVYGLDEVQATNVAYALNQEAKA